MKKELEAEFQVAREAAGLIYRRPNYYKMALGLYLISFTGYERGLLMRSSYYPIRYVDDRLDGDAGNIENPVEYARELQDQIRTGSFDDSNHERLLKFSLEKLETKAKSGDNPRQNFVDAIEAIIFDNERAKERRLLSGVEIEQYYRRAFDPVINITLQAIDSNLRSGDMSALSYGQGRVYSVRDLAIDWPRGIINIPAETLVQAGLSSSSTLEEVQKNPVVREWFRRGLLRTKPDLLDLQAKLTAIPEKQTKLVLGSLISPLIKFIDSSLDSKL